MSQAYDAFSRLAALKPARRRVAVERLDQDTPRLRPDVPDGAARLAEILGATTRSNRFGEFLALRRWFSEVIDGGSGSMAPEGAFDPAALRLIAPEAPKEAADPTQWLFLDTETTGISGGTGTYPFLVGIAWWDAGGLEVEQFFMREHSEEHSLLVALAERMAERRVLATFNGKSFDWPLLETRYRMTRTVRPPVPRAHLDFLHPARNLWRRRLGSARLPELERHVLGWNRGADMMSELIPSIYFDFLRGGPPEPLVPIFQHNQMDLRGLAALASRVLSAVGNTAVEGCDALEIFGVSRICERRGEAVRARTLYERSIAGKLPPETDRAARRALARLIQREGDFARAIDLWQGILGSTREGFEAYEQLAIHYEHRVKEPHRAATLTKKALTELRKAHRLGLVAPVAYRQQKQRFEKRLARLERKAGRTLLDAMAAGSAEPAD